MVKFLSALLLLFAASCQAPMAGSDCTDCDEPCADCAEAMECEACAAGEECTECESVAVAASLMVAELEGGECAAGGDGMKDCCAEMDAEACSEEVVEEACCEDEGN